jgi:hypothetical protein
VSLFRREMTEFSDLEGELRRERPVPSSELLGRLKRDRSPDDRHWARPLRARLALAGGLTALLLGALAVVGGLGQAASGGRVALEQVKDVVSAPFKNPKQSPGTHGTATTTTGAPSGSLSSLDPPPGTPPGQDQYKPGCGRGDPNEPHTGPPGNHNGFPGRCPPSAPPPVTPLP